MSTIRIHTAQNVTLEYEVASVGERIVAALIDYLVLIAWFIACGALFTAIASADKGPHKNAASGDDATSLGIIVILVLVGAPYVFYNLICEVFFNGQSVGKKARHLKVMRLDGTAPRLSDYLLRWLLRLIDTGLFGGLVAVLTISASGRGQRLGDMAAGTTVVSLRPRAQYGMPMAAAINSPLDYQVVFPQVSLLADHDVALVRQLVQQAAARSNFTIINEVATKVKTLTGIQTNMQDVPFLQTVLRDHAHLASTL